MYKMNITPSELLEQYDKDLNEHTASSYKFEVYRAGMRGNHLMPYSELVNFVSACGVDCDFGNLQFVAIVQGMPFEIDGAMMRFVAIKP